MSESVDFEMLDNLIANPHTGYMSNHTYTVRATNYGQPAVTGNEAYITRRFGSRIWEHFGDVVDHAADCRCRKPVEIPADPFGTPADIVAPF